MLGGAVARDGCAHMLTALMLPHAADDHRRRHDVRAQGTTYNIDDNAVSTPVSARRDGGGTCGPGEEHLVCRLK